MDNIYSMSRIESFNKCRLQYKYRYIEVSTVNGSMLNRMMKSWPQEMVAKINDFLVKKVIRKVDLRKKN